jgi:ribosomal protein S18 acetylase RimI-like enzyme
MIFLGRMVQRLKILQNNRLIGGAFLTFTRKSQKGELVLFGLDTAYQGRGLGQKVWRHIE